MVVLPMAALLLHIPVEAEVVQGVMLGQADLDLGRRMAAETVEMQPVHKLAAVAVAVALLQGLLKVELVVLEVGLGC
jgi:hypothetical protein